MQGTLHIFMNLSTRRVGAEISPYHNNTLGEITSNGGDSSAARVEAPLPNSATFLFGNLPISAVMVYGNNTSVIGALSV